MLVKVFHKFRASAAASGVLLAEDAMQAASASPNQALQPTRANKPARSVELGRSKEGFSCRELWFMGRYPPARPQLLSADMHSVLEQRHDWRRVLR
jgi:hypothetical protein